MPPKKRPPLPPSANRRNGPMDVNANPLLKRYLVGATATVRRGDDDVVGDGKRQQHQPQPTHQHKRLAVDPSQLVAFGKRRLTRHVGIFAHAKRSDDVIGRNGLQDDVIVGQHKRCDDAIVGERNGLGGDDAIAWNDGRFGAAACRNGPDGARDGGAVGNDAATSIGACDDWSADMRRILGCGDVDGAAERRRLDIPCGRAADRLKDVDAERPGRPCKKLNTAYDARTDVSRWSTGASSTTRHHGGVDDGATIDHVVDDFPRDPPMAAIAERLLATFPDLSTMAGIDDGCGQTYSSRLKQQIRRQMLETNPHLRLQMEDAAAEAVAATSSKKLSKVVVEPIRNCGKNVCWDNTIAYEPAYKEYDEITMEHIFDGPGIFDNQYSSRGYVEPRWIYDCLNARTLSPIDNYLTDAALSPDLSSPFVQESTSHYDFPPQPVTFLEQDEPDVPGLIVVDKVDDVLDDIPTMDFKFSRRRMF